MRSGSESKFQVFAIFFINFNIQSLNTIFYTDSIITSSIILIKQ